MRSSVLRISALWAMLPLMLAQSSQELPTGNVVTGKVTGGGVERYRFTAKAGAVLHVSVKTEGGQPDISLVSPNSRRLPNSEGAAYRSRRIDFYWLARDEGTYQLEVRGPSYLDAAVSYELLLELPHEPNSTDQKRFEGDGLIVRARKANRDAKLDDAERLYEAAAAQYEQAGDSAAERAALRELEIFQENQRHNFGKALTIIQKATAISSADPDPWEAGMFQNGRGYCQMRLGELDPALSTFKEALETRREAGDVPGEAQTLGNIGEVLRRLSRAGEAAEMYAESAALFAKAKNPAGERNVLSAEAAAEHDQGRFHDEIELLDRTLALARATQDRRFEGNVLLRKGAALAGLNRPKESIEPLQAAGAAFEELKDDRSLGNVFQELGRDYWASGNVADASAAFERAISLRRAASDAVGLAQSLTNLANLITREGGDFDQAQKLLTEALAIATAGHDDVNRAYVLLTFGELAVARRELPRAIEYLRLSVAAADASGRLNQMAWSHQALARELSRLQRFDEAIPEYETAVSQFERAVMPAEQATSLVELGRAYASTNRSERAQELFNAALSVRRGMKDRGGEADTLNAIGMAHRFVDEYDQAIESFGRARSIYESLGDVRGRGASLNYLGMTYGSIGASEESISSFRDSLALIRPLGHTSLEVSLLNNLGYTYDHLGDASRAVGYLEEAVSIGAGLRRGHAAIINYNNLAHALRGLGDAAKAEETARKALEFARADADRYSEWRSLLEVAAAADALGRKADAEKSLDQAREIAEQSTDSSHAARVWEEIGQRYESQHDYAKAIKALENAAAGYTLARDRQMEAEALSSLSTAFRASGQPWVAVVYGKQAVNALQSVRTNVDSLQEELQASFLDTHKQQYRDLADLLISLGRLPEAREVLDMLKQAEYRDFVGRDEAEPTGGARTVLLSAEEREFAERYAQISGRIVALGRRRSELLAKVQRTAAEDAELKQLESDMEAGNAVFQETLNSIAASFAAKPEAGIRMNLLRESEGFKEDLAELRHNAVIIYTLVTGDRYRAILVTPDIQKAYEYPIRSAALARKVFDFREALQNPRSDPLPLARELYRIMIGPQLEADLRQAHARTLMWSLDGVLRYVPLAALNDGSKYMVESFAQVIFTPASNARWKDVPKTQWEVAGFGVTKAHDKFPALPGVAAELKGIIGPVLPGQIRVDEAFTLDAMQGLLRQGYPVVHLASHFKFEPGSKSLSYLLIGDGSHLTVAEMERMNNLFAGVDLLTLSACNTGVGDLNADGGEVEGLGTLAQRKGAKAVVASLWSVADASTSLLMERFYEWHKQHPEGTKVEALRQAQLALLHSDASGETAESSRRGVALDSVSNGPYVHPYFWAPFFMMGNWL